MKSTGKDVEEREHQATVGGSVNWFSHYGKQYGGFSIDQKQNHLKNPAILVLGIQSKRMKTLIRKDICTPTFTAEFFKIAKIKEAT